MDCLDGFQELKADDQHSVLIVPVMQVELFVRISYFLNGTGVGYCGLLIDKVDGKGLRGCIEAVAAKAYVGRTIFVFLSELDDGKKLITVPALFEKEPTFNGSIDLSGFVIKTYYPDGFKRTLQEVYKEHLNALIGKKVCNDKDCLTRDLLELPKKGIEILKAYR